MTAQGGKKQKRKSKIFEKKVVGLPDKLRGKMK